MEKSEKIDLKSLLDLLLSKAKWIALAGVLFGVAAYFYSVYMITPLYTVDVSIYVNNKKSLNLTAEQARQEDITTSQNLVPTYISILRSRTTLTNVIAASGVSYSTNALRNMISTSIEANTGIFKVYLKNPDPKTAVLLANTVARIAMDEIPDYVEGTSARVIDYAEMPLGPSSPNVGKNIAISFLAGIILSVLIILLIDFLDVRIRTEADLMSLKKLPMLGVIPDLDKVNTDAEYYTSATLNEQGASHE